VHVVQPSQLLYFTTDANNPTPNNIVWHNIGHPSLEWISDIDVDEQNPKNFWLVYGGSQLATSKVYRYEGATTFFSKGSPHNNIYFW